jgi:distribution and morphology protein 31
MQVAKSFTLGRSLSAQASTSRLRLKSPATDRYVAIHAFFTRQAHSFARSSLPSVPLRQQIRFKRFNSSHPSSSSPHDHKPCPHCPPANGPVIQRGHAQEYTPFIRRLIQRTQSISHDSPHRPTKEQLLGAARGRWERFRIRMQWFFIRGWRRFNTDDFSAFASLFVFGNSEWFKPKRKSQSDQAALWILIGTTTFVSAIFATLNSLSLQEYVARYISDYLTSETGVNVL